MCEPAQPFLYLAFPVAFKHSFYSSLMENICYYTDPKKLSARQFNDFRPVALTSVVAKCMERIVSDQLISSVADRVDPLQFAYKAKRGVEDATLTLLIRYIS